MINQQITNMSGQIIEEFKKDTAALVAITQLIKPHFSRRQKNLELQMIKVLLLDIKEHRLKSCP